MAAVARAWGVPENTLHGWVHAMEQHPEEPFVGSGRLRAAEQVARDLERRLRDLEFRRGECDPKKSEAPRHQRPEVT